jgi:sugar O-acyltransferase (sialic acid O-acetyltransferase NeuD family)
VNGDIVYGFLDDKSTEKLPKFNILGKVESILNYFNKGFCFIVAIGDNHIRQKIMESYYMVEWYTAIHPSAVIANDVQIGKGTAIMANAVINPGSKVGCGAIINTASTVDHDCVIGDFVHISPGAHLAGTVRVGDRTWIGMGANVINNIDICADCTIGAGTVVIKNINECGTYVGVPAIRKI